MKYEAYMCRGYGFGLGYDFLGSIGIFDTEQEASDAAEKFSNESRPNNCPDCYDMGRVREIKEN